MPVAEEHNGGMEMLSALMGEQGKDALQMIRRMERLKRLMGTPAPAPVEDKKEETDLFARSRNESMISAAIPFLDWEYQKNLYVIVRLMEMRRVLSGDLLEIRGKQGEEPHLRRRKMLHAVRPYLAEGEKQQLDTIMKMMDMRAILEQEGRQ